MSAHSSLWKQIHLMHQPTPEPSLGMGCIQNERECPSKKTLLSLRRQPKGVRGDRKEPGSADEYRTVHGGNEPQSHLPTCC